MEGSRVKSSYIFWNRCQRGQSFDIFSRLKTKGDFMKLFTQVLIVFAFLLHTTSSFAQSAKIKYSFERTDDGSYACFKYTADGHLLNGGYAVADSFCGPSKYSFGPTSDGISYACFKYTLNGDLLNSGFAVADSDCGPVQYSFGRTDDGTYACFKYTLNGDLLNSGYAVGDSYCE
jgi:hypothetical protein